MRFATVGLVIAVPVTVLVTLGASAHIGEGSSALKPNVTFVTEKFSLSNGGEVNASVACPAGTRIFSGGYASTGEFAHVTVAAPAVVGNHYILSAWMPPANINVPVLRETAVITVAAWCAPTGEPIVLGDYTKK
jgi:hypothetical protein